jgi:sigma-E factor negative regulatory protein RseB
MDKWLVLLLLCGAAPAIAATPSSLDNQSAQTKQQTGQPTEQQAQQPSEQQPQQPTEKQSGQQPQKQADPQLPTQVKPPNVDAVLSQVRRSLNTLNYEASFVLMRGKFAEPYNWMHGIYEGTEIEYMRSQNGANIEIVRKDDLVGYFEAESKPHSVRSKAIQGVLPTLFFDDEIVLGDYYSIAVGGRSRVLDRAAQLFKIVARDDFRFNYWLWLDIKTGLILKSALVSKQGEVLEQFQITHLNVLEQPPKLAKKLSETELPTPIKPTTNANNASRWKVNWLPQGFKIVSTNQHKLSLTGEFTDYILVTDGLVELSIFIQQPLNNKIKSGHLRSGSNVVAVHHANGFDVSVIGKVPAITAERIAQSVTAG